MLSLLLLVPQAWATPIGDAPYTVGVNDHIEVFVWQHTDLSMTVEVGADGTIQYPLIGELQVQGLTPDTVATQIADGLSTYIVDPQVTVIPRDFGKAVVAVIGEVKTAGLVKFRKGALLTDYLAAAGGPTTDAKLSKLTVTRSMAGNPINIEIDADALFKSGDPSLDLELQEGDVVYVPKAFTLIDTRTLVLSATSVLGVLSVILRVF